MMSEELGLQPVESSPLSSGLVVGASYIVAAAVPLLPYLVFTGGRALLASMMLTASALYLVGVGKARITQRPEFRAGVEMMLTGLIGTGGCWAIGHVVARAFGAAVAP